jgi:chromosome segregation ATPase
MSIQLTQLEGDYSNLERESTAAQSLSQSELAAVTGQLRSAQEAGSAVTQSLSASQEELRQTRALLADAESRVQALTLKVTHLEEQQHQGLHNLAAAQEKVSALDQQLRDAQEQSRSASQATARALETQSAAHILSQAQQRDAVLEANARCGQLAAQLGACEQRLQTAIGRAAAAEKRAEDLMGDTAHQLEQQEQALEAVSAAHKRQHDAAVAAAGLLFTLNFETLHFLYLAIRTPVRVITTCPRRIGSECGRRRSACSASGGGGGGSGGFAKAARARASDCCRYMAGATVSRCAWCVASFH